MNATAIACTLMAVAMAAPTAAAGTLENLALGRGASVVAGSASGASPSTLTDGVFRPAGTQWQSGTVWWSGTSTVLQIDLDGPVELSGAIVQADNNDTYRLWYRDLATGTYAELWTVAAVGGAGMRTRPDPTDNTEIHFLPAPVITDAIRIAAIGGDGAYSLSEVQVWGVVPAPGAAAVLLAAGRCARRRRAA
jgi:hypothetical protein